MFLDLSGDDFDEAAEAFGQSFDTPPIVVTPTGKKFWWRHTVAGDSLLNLRQSWASARFETTSTGATDDYFVSWIKSGQSSLENQGVTRDCPHLVPFVMHNGHSAGKTTATDIVNSNVHIDKSFLQGVAEEIEDTDFLDFETLVAIDGPQLQTWRKTVGLVASIVLDTSHPATTLLQREMPRLVAIAMLNCFPYQSHDRASKSLGIEPTSVRVAIDYIQHNAHLPIGPVDIAQAAGLSVRSLQQALRRYRETTPTTLLHMTRLDRAHAELQAADPRIDSVSTIAHRWGFIHLGRFSGSYKTRFRQLPGHTLRSR